jgi:ubiquinol-cytochrome c reductase iron-sulfur subunit
MTASRAVALALAISVAGSIALVVIYLVGGSAQLQGIGLAVALGGMGTAIVIWALALIEAPVEIEELHSFATGRESAGQGDRGIGAEEISRRRFLTRLLGGAGGILAAALVLPAFSLGPQPGTDLFRTAWRRGMRLVDVANRPVRPADLVADSVRTVFPEGFVGRPDSQTLLIKVSPSDLALPNGRDAWAPEGCVAYSKVCTHAGCPVGLYRAKEHLLLCPCHQSTFDVLRGATPIFGPAARPLPQLPMEVDAEGYLVAMGDFPEPIGPGFWDMTRTPQEGS